MPQPLSELPPQVYVDPRPPEYFGPFYEWARTHGPDWVYDLARLVFAPFCMLAFRARCIDAPRVPRRGPAILAPNHFSAMDHFFAGIYLRRRIRFMAKSQLFRGVLKEILRHGGAFPVRRGHHDEESIVTAKAILQRGGVIVIYPEGGRSRSARIGSHARPGVGRLALETGAPVVPVAIHGSLRARNWKRLEFPSVTVQYGELLSYPAVEHSTRAQQQVVADEVLATVRSLYIELDRAGRKGAIRAARDRRDALAAQA